MSLRKVGSPGILRKQSKPRKPWCSPPLPTADIRAGIGVKHWFRVLPNNLFFWGSVVQRPYKSPYKKLGRCRVQVGIQVQVSGSGQKALNPKQGSSRSIGSFRQSRTPKETGSSRILIKRPPEKKLWIQGTGKTEGFGGFNVGASIITYTIWGSLL